MSMWFFTWLHFGGKFVRFSVYQGAGGYGAVFKCNGISDGVSYAIKKIPFDDEEGVNYWGEARIMAGFKHKNIIRYYQAWQEKLDADDNIEKILACADYSSDPKKVEELAKFEKAPEVSKQFCLLIVMELCKSSLYKMVMNEKKPIDIEEAWMLFRQIVEGLHYIHSHQVIHRDLSIQNILVDDSGTIRIIDFGLAKKCVENEQLRNSNSDRGLKMFRAPEMRSTGPIDEKVDIYSLGAILVCLLYPCTTKMAIAKVLSDFENKGKLPDDWKDRGGESLIRKLLSKKPGERPSTAYILEFLNKNSKPE